MSYYPVFIDLTEKEILVTGAGEVGLRKITSLLPAAPGNITVIDPRLTDAAMEHLTAQGSVTCHSRAFVPEDIDGKTLVFAATDNRSVNALVALLCHGRGILCNIADAPDQSDFFVPAHFSTGDITVAISTGGHSPALARRLRTELEEWVGNRYTGLVTVLGRLRPLVLELAMPTAENSALFRALVDSPLAELLADGKTAEAGTLLARHLPAPLHPRMRGLLHGL